MHNDIARTGNATADGVVAVTGGKPHFWKRGGGVCRATAIDIAHGMPRLSTMLSLLQKEG